MPPRIRTKALKENVDSENINRKPKTIKNVKTLRKVLGDKTNSLSDDNDSIEIPIRKTNRVIVTSEKNISKPDIEINKERPRRQRRLPNRYFENHVLNNLSNSKDLNDVAIPKTTKKLQDNPVQNAKKAAQAGKHSPLVKKPVEVNENLKSNQHEVQIKTSTKETPLCSKLEINGTLCVNTPSSFQTPVKNADHSIVIDRPRRICRLPSRFEDHSVSPSKFIPVQPCNASTPIVSSKTNTKSIINTQNKVKNLIKTQKSLKSKKKSAKDALKTSDQQFAKKVVETSKSTKNITQKKLDEYLKEKVSPDTNNNPKRQIRNKRLLAKKVSPIASPKTLKNIGRRLINKSNSFRVLEDKAENKNIDVYEFTFDPNEEPTPKKKKRKKVVKKKQTQPKKQFLYNNNYDKNVSKALAALKSVVAKKPVESQIVKVVNKQPEVDNVQKQHSTVTLNNVQNVKDVTEPLKPSSSGVVNTSVVQIHSPVYEDDPYFDNFGIDLNYSPTHANSEPKLTKNITQDQPQEQGLKDPLNLHEDLSFFDDPPVASSSVNVSTRNPFASPWRVEFESLPIKWHVNSYVKSNMTPAVESSFISSEENVKKKHVYTNMVPLNNDSLPQIVDNQPNLMQTSIVSFIKEVVEKQARKKLHKSHRKVNSLFEDITNTTNYDIYTPKKPVGNTSDDRHNSDRNSSNSKDVSNDKEITKENRKRKNHNDIHSLPAKSPRREKNKDCTYFGFEDTEDHDENVSPVRNKNRIRSLRPRAKAVLNEINGPTRPVLPVAAKSNVPLGSGTINKVYEDLKSAADAPPFKEWNVKNIETTNIDESQVVVNDDESQSVHLFEDIDIVHYLKPTRKSYGKAKKVTFRPRSLSDSDTHSDNGAVVDPASSEEDNLSDLSFHIPKLIEKKKRTKKKSNKKKLLSKKEEKEADAWAAGFNSMCEDIEEFPLVVE